MRLDSLKVAALWSFVAAALGCGASTERAGSPAPSSAPSTNASAAGSSSAAATIGAPPSRQECDSFMDIVARTTALRGAIHREASTAAKATDWAARTDALAEEAKALQFSHPDLATEVGALARRMGDLAKDLKVLAIAEKGQDFGATNAAHAKVLRTSEQVEVIAREPAARCAGETKSLQATPGRLPPQVVGRVIRERLGDARKCYEDGLKRDPTLQGRIAVRFVIGTDGKVVSAVLATRDDGSSADAAPAGTSVTPPLTDGAVTTCVLGVFKQLVFPPPDGGTLSVLYPITFGSTP